MLVALYLLVWALVFELKNLIPVEQLYFFSSGTFLTLAIFGPGTLDHDAIQALEVTQCASRR